jgi:ParB family transcriptional regulator, chromosome partitioning protein
LEGETKDISLSLVEDNPFNARVHYDEQDLKRLASSIRRSGLITSIKVRKSGDKFQAVCGHRRIKAARLIGLETIRAEVAELSDSEMLGQSLVENMERSELSDFEKGLALSRMSEEFGYSYTDVGQLVGLSRQHVSNLIRMTRLFDADMLSNDTSLLSDLHTISEHHARLLMEIRDPQTRAGTLKLVISDGLSVRDLQRLIHRLRSWFVPASENRESGVGEQYETGARSHMVKGGTDAGESETEKIVAVLNAEFQLPHGKDFSSFDSMHAFDHDGFSIYDDFPPYTRLARVAARNKEMQWFYSIAPNYTTVLRDIDIQFFSETALATLYVDYGDKLNGDKHFMTTRGTVIFLRIQNDWKVLHEHWSRLESADDGCEREARLSAE